MSLKLWLQVHKNLGKDYGRSAGPYIFFSLYFQVGKKRNVIPN